MTHSLVDLKVDSLITAVEADPRLAGLIDDPLRCRLAVIVDEASRAAADSSAVAQSAFTQIADVLRRRLSIAADRRDHSQIADEQISRPIFVVGFPRTGTSLLQSLLAEAPGARSPELWEVRNPSPPPRPEKNEVHRIALGDAAASEWCRDIPGILTLHPYFDKGGRAPVEDEEIMALDFQSAYPTWYSKMPVSLSAVGSTDPASGYQFHRQFLQQMQAGRRTDQWVLKGTAHQFTLAWLWEEYPDALCIWPHRHPSEALASVFAAASLVNEGICGHVDRPQLAQTMREGIRLGLDFALSSPLVDDKRLVHVTYTDVVADPVGVIRGAYEQWALPFTREYEVRMHGWLSDPANKSNRHGKFKYSLSEFRMSEDEINDQFADYIDRFLSGSSR